MPKYAHHLQKVRSCTFRDLLSKESEEGAEKYTEFRYVGVVRLIVGTGELREIVVGC